MSKKTKAFIYNLLCFAIIFFITRYLVNQYTGLTGFFVPLTAFVVGTILAPKFQAGVVNNEEKIFMKSIFLKGFKEIE